MLAFRKSCPGDVMLRFVEYLEICSKVVRNSLKDEFKSVACKRNEVFLKVADWKNGVPGEAKVIEELRQEEQK